MLNYINTPLITKYKIQKYKRQKITLKHVRYLARHFSLCLARVARSKMKFKLTIFTIFNVVYR